MREEEKKKQKLEELRQKQAEEEKKGRLELKTAEGKVNWFGVGVGIAAILGLLISLYANVIRPHLVKPEIKLSVEHYFVAKNMAAHRFVISNVGNGAARDLNLFFTLKPDYEIRHVSSSPIYEKLKGGEGTSTVEAYWVEIGPQNSISVYLLSTAESTIPKSVFPLEFKVWYKDKLVERDYFGP